MKMKELRLPHATVRIVVEDDRVLLVANDVADASGYIMRWHAIKKWCVEEKLYRVVKGEGGRRSVRVLTVDDAMRLADAPTAVFGSVLKKELLRLEACHE